MGPAIWVCMKGVCRGCCRHVVFGGEWDEEGSGSVEPGPMVLLSGMQSLTPTKGNHRVRLAMSAAGVSYAWPSPL